MCCATQSFAEQALVINKELPVELKSENTTLQSKNHIVANVLDVNQVFGVQLGEKINNELFPSCSSITGLTNTCYATYPFKRIALAKKEAPKYIKDKIIYVFEVNDKVEKLQFLTNGYQDQEDVFKTLIHKYGKPSKHWMSKSSNAFGRVAESINAIWSFGDVEIIFVGVAGRIDKGGVGFTTKKFRDYESQQQLDKKSRERSL